MQLIRPALRSRPFRPALVVSLVVVSLAAGCGGSTATRRLKRTELQANLKKMESPGLLIGEFPLDSILDGDTIRVAGLQQSLRLSGIDTEETFKNDGDRRLFEAGWEEYLKAKRGDSKHPVKMATPLGEEAKLFAKHFFEGSPMVRLERDHPKELRDTFGRYLTYVFAMKDGQWVNYNVECVRAGMSPYFSKYGYSKRFHKEFVEAEREAMADKRGIWSEDGMHYPDYAERKPWWDGRAEFLKKVEAEGEGKPDFVVLSRWDSPLNLERREGKEVTIVGLISKTVMGDGRAPSRAVLSRTRGNNFSLIFFDKDVYGLSNIGKYKGDFIQVTGVVTRYKNPALRRNELQMVITMPSQVMGRPLDPVAAVAPPVDEDLEEGNRDADGHEKGGAGEVPEKSGGRKMDDSPAKER